MNVDIRKSIINNFKGSNTKEISESIYASISTNDEIMLPGLGVFFDLLWKNSTENEKTKILNKLEKSIAND